jgi:uncharacterized protein (TIGR02145 family)
MKILKSKVSILFVIVLLNNPGCKKNETPEPFNPLNGLTTAIFNPNKNYGIVTDVDGNTYKTITIGEQIWMAENLRVTRYRNGDTIPRVIDTEEWRNLDKGAYCHYNSTNNFDTIATYGRLYNWFAATDSRNIAPKGWRVATSEDWNILIDYLGGDEVAGNKLKEAGYDHWTYSNDADNSSGFTALPGGYRPHDKKTEQMNLYGGWWTTKSYDSTTAIFFYINDWQSTVYNHRHFKITGISIRCIKN